MSSIYSGGPVGALVEMEMRDWFAGQAPTNELALPKMTPDDIRSYLGERAPYGEFPANWKARVYARARYQWADAMLEARK